MARYERSSDAASKGERQDLTKSKKPVLKIVCYTKHKNLHFRVKFEAWKRHIHPFRQLGLYLDKEEKDRRRERATRFLSSHGAGGTDSTRGGNDNTILYKGRPLLYN
jgi:hypothetical protein